MTRVLTRGSLLVSNVARHQSPIELLLVVDVDTTGVMVMCYDSRYGRAPAYLTWKSAWTLDQVYSELAHGV